jgi:quercetin dioxygenase-like cupin family protein
MASNRNRTVGVGALVLFALGSIGVAAAQTAPRSFVASPEVYKVLARNDQYVVVEVLWKKGQRDQLHSHPSAAVYRLSECSMTVHYPDGRTTVSEGPAGAAWFNEPVDGHWVENTGNTDCRVIMFEPK